MAFKSLKIAGSLIATLTLAACASHSNTQSVNYLSGNEQQLYQTAVTDIKNHDYLQANNILTQLSLQYPFGMYKNQVQVLLTYSQYELGNYLQAGTLTNSYFANATTGTPMYGDYMLLVNALAALKQNRGIFQELFNTNPLENDLTGVNTAIADLSVLISSYTDSQYLDYAKKLYNFLTGVVAQYNLTVAKFYIKYNDPVAAYRRADIVIQNYPNTIYAKPAVDLMKQAAKIINLPQYNKEITAIENSLKGVPVQEAIIVMPKLDNVMPTFLPSFAPPKATSKTMK